MVLRNLGCENVVYVTRTGDVSGFAKGVAELLGVSFEDAKALFDVDGPSADSLALTEADATWCTDWNNPEPTDLVAMTLNSYNAPMVTTSSFFAEGDPAYPEITAETGLRGCTPPVND